MGKIAFVFSGQGDQFPGMGKDLYDKYITAQSIFNMCDEIRPGTSKQCFEGTEDELKETKNTQCCLFAMELAAASILLEKGVKPDMLAGFSLGEVVAMTVGGAFDIKTGFGLVTKRGELMQKAAEGNDTAMAVVLKLTEDVVEELCGKYQWIYPVNYNCPGQISVSGLAEQMPEFFNEVKDVGGRAMPLKVKGAFHSPYMNDAALAFKAELEKANISELKTPVISNKTAMPYEGDVVSLLSSQICSPVKWEKSVRYMIEQGVDTFIEIGPGKTLTNMIKKINPDVKAVSVNEYLSEVEGC